MIKLSTTFFIADPYNINHLKILEEFEQENNLAKKLSSSLKEMKKETQKKVHQQNLTLTNEIHEIFFIKEGEKIKDCGYLNGEKDIKICRISLVPITNKHRKILTKITDYAFHILGMEEVFINVKSEEKELKKTIEEQGFESLGDENKVTTYIKENPKYIELGSTNEINKKH